ncbi:hypothetical protein [Bradyrhizobium sp. CER78]|uniref:hypothetical protein n=1 Tax=Bradyrhizobium sp. CER78 TaxID=3039162 RepID=UPI00244931AE|nr:hypothetical protein [Bradyrhizobium sp. CER78]MDH2386454.1 hypothetical protein [Bradyrhizobium sp. CER78]
MPAVVEQFAGMLAAAGVKRIYSIVGDSLSGLMDAICKQGKIEWLWRIRPPGAAPFHSRRCLAFLFQLKHPDPTVVGLAHMGSSRNNLHDAIDLARRNCALSILNMGPIEGVFALPRLEKTSTRTLRRCSVRPDTDRLSATTANAATD